MNKIKSKKLIILENKANLKNLMNLIQFNIIQIKEEN
jgi:hypothetical protein